MGQLTLEELNDFVGIGLWLTLAMASLFGFFAVRLGPRNVKVRKPEDFDQWLKDKKKEKPKPYNKDSDGDGPIIDI